MLMCALLIHLTGGRIETHFHVFGSLAFLAFYRDWRVLVPATVVVAADHALRGIFWPQSVYGLLTVSSWRWLEHAAWVLFEDVFLVMSCLRGTREVQQIAVRTATLERAHQDQTRHAIEQTELVARLRLSQQEVEAATRAKSEFVANMSHELRTPLNAITLYSELLQEGAQMDGREDDVADLAKIRVSSKHLLGLINGLLDLSKIEAGKMDLEIETFDVRTNVQELIGTIDALIRQNGNTLTVTFDGDPGAMSADATKTRQILFNLLSNAAKFTSQGAIALRVARPTIDGVSPCRVRRHRHRHRRDRGTEGAAVPALRAGRHVDCPQVRRHRPRAGAGVPLLRDDGRPRRRRVARRRRHAVHGAVARRGRAGRRRRPRAAGRVADGAERHAAAADRAARRARGDERVVLPSPLQGRYRRESDPVPETVAAAGGAAPAARGGWRRGVRRVRGRLRERVAVHPRYRARLQDAAAA